MDEMLTSRDQQLRKDSPKRPKPESWQLGKGRELITKLGRLRNRKLELSGYIRRRNIKPLIYITNMRNKLLYGPEAPIYAERIWINPMECRGIPRTLAEELGWGQPGVSAVIYDSWPVADSQLLQLDQMDKIKYCIRHWRDGIPWENSGIYEYYSKLGYDIGEVKHRHEYLDLLFNDVKREKCLKSRDEILGYPSIEFDGIVINVGPKNELLFADCGTHRLAIALVLGLQIVPAQIGCVHKDAIPQLHHWRHLDRHSSRAN